MIFPSISHHFVRIQTMAMLVITRWYSILSEQVQLSELPAGVGTAPSVAMVEILRDILVLHN